MQKKLCRYLLPFESTIHERDRQTDRPQNGNVDTNGSTSISLRPDNTPHLLHHQHSLVIFLVWTWVESDISNIHFSCPHKQSDQTLIQSPTSFWKNRLYCCPYFYHHQHFLCGMKGLEVGLRVEVYDRPTRRVLVQENSGDIGSEQSLSPHPIQFRSFQRRSSQPITWLILTNKTVQGNTQTEHNSKSKQRKYSKTVSDSIVTMITSGLPSRILNLYWTNWALAVVCFCFCFYIFCLSVLD